MFCSAIEKLAKVGRCFCHGAADIAVQEIGIIAGLDEWRSAGGAGIGVQDRVLGVEGGKIARRKDVPCNRAGAGLGENLNATIAQAIKLGGEGVLIDDDFANRGFGRNLSAGKAVNVDLAAIGAGGRTGESLQFAGQFVGIVGERVKILALDDSWRWHWIAARCRWWTSRR